MKNAWFQIRPDRIKNVASSLPDGRMRATLTLVLMTYLAEGGLPDDDRKIAFLCGLPADDVAALRPYWEFMGRVEDGRIYIDYAEEVMAEQQMFIEKKAKAARARWGTNGQPGRTTTLEEVADDSDGLEVANALSVAEQSYAMHNNAEQGNPELCQTTMHSCNHADKQAKSMHAQGVPTREKYPDGSTMAKIDAMEECVLQAYAFTYIDTGIDRQVKTSVAKCNAAGFGVSDIQDFLSTRTKLPGVGFLCNEMQTWRTSKARQAQKDQSPAKLFKIPPVPEGLTPGEQKRFVEDAIRNQRQQTA